MIDIELPCCGGEAHLAELADEIRCEGCGVVVALASDPAPAPLGLAPATMGRCPVRPGTRIAISPTFERRSSLLGGGLRRAG